METRIISLTLEKAKEWYNSGSADLKEVALQAYTKNELETFHFSEIKTFEDAKKALGMNYNDDITIHYPYKTGNIYRHLMAIYKLDIIRKALNPTWRPKLNSGTVYYPWVRWYPANKAKEEANSRGWVVGDSFLSDGGKFTLVGGTCGDCNYGIGYFSYGCGGAYVVLGLLCCETREIAQHMCKYFSKEIFEACYAHFDNYKWVN